MDWSYPGVYLTLIEFHLLPLAIKANDWVTRNYSPISAGGGRKAERYFIA
jgi:hypothetical protein